MSKIQKALGKMQAVKTKSPRGRVERPSIDDSIIVAKLVDRGKKEETYDVSDICLHVDDEALRDAGLIAPEYHEQLLAKQYREYKCSDERHTR